MLPKTTLFTFLLLLAAGTATGLAAEKAAGRVTIKIVAQDPDSGATLAAGDRLFLRLGYDSSVPVRFLAAALRQEVLQEEAFTNSAPPYAAGSGEALAWLGFPGPVRIDAVRVTAYDLEWQELATVTFPSVVTWEEAAGAAPREPAAWVGPAQKHHRHVFDTALDPLPRKPDPFFDIFLLISIISFPCYVAAQLRMLMRYQGIWRWYAAAPLLPILPLSLYSLIGLGMESTYWVIFLTRYFPVALAYLGIVWLVKWFRTKTDASAGAPT